MRDGDRGRVGVWVVVWVHDRLGFGGLEGCRIEKRPVRFDSEGVAVPGAGGWIERLEFEFIRMYGMRRGVLPEL